MFLSIYLFILQHPLKSIMCSRDLINGNNDNIFIYGCFYLVTINISFVELFIVPIMYTN